MTYTEFISKLGAKVDDFYSRVSITSDQAGTEIHYSASGRVKGIEQYLHVSAEGKAPEVVLESLDVAIEKVKAQHALDLAQASEVLADAKSK